MKKDGIESSGEEKKVEWSKIKVVKLRKERGLSTQGKKSVLIKRLEENETNPKKKKASKEKEEEESDEKKSKKKKRKNQILHQSPSALGVGKAYVNCLVFQKILH